VPGEVIKPDAIKVVKGEGFPEYRRIFNKGDLYVVYVFFCVDGDVAV
jgi:DnaJ family protein A protein 2